MRVIASGIVMGLAIATGCEPDPAVSRDRDALHQRDAASLRPPVGHDEYQETIPNRPSIEHRVEPGGIAPD